MKLTKKIVSAVMAIVLLLTMAVIPSVSVSASENNQTVQTPSSVSAAKTGLTVQAASSAPAADNDQTVQTASKKVVQITGSSVNLRKGAGTGYGRVATVKKGAQFTYLAAKTVSGVKWYQIQYNSTTKAWVTSKYSKIVTVSSSEPAEPDEPSVTVKKVQITGNPVNLRKGAGTKYGKVATVKKGAQFTYLATKTVSGVKWYQIQYNSTTKAWVSGQFAKIVTVSSSESAEPDEPSVTTKKVQITGSSVNLRKGAGTKYGRVATVKKGSQYTYLATKTVSGVKWYQIQYNSTTKAWVTSKYSKIVTVTSGQTDPIVKSTVNVVGALAEARVSFPDGKYWNSVGLSKKNTDGYTSEPCPSGHDSTTCNGQCAGYTDKIGEKIYGTSASTWTVVAKNTTWNKVKDSICIGDVIRYNNKHSVMVTAIDGDDIYVTDCNWNYHCRISWDREFDVSKYISAVNYVYRNSANNFRSGLSPLYVKADSDAIGIVKIRNDSEGYSGDIDSEKYNDDIDYYYSTSYKNTVNAYESPDENSKVVAKPLDGEYYYCYGKKLVGSDVYYLVKFNSVSGWVRRNDVTFTDNLGSCSDGSWSTDEIRNDIFQWLIKYSDSSRLEVYTETVDFERSEVEVFDSHCFSSKEEFKTTLKNTFDRYAASGSGYEKCCFYMEYYSGTDYVIVLIFC